MTRIIISNFRFPIIFSALLILLLCLLRPAYGGTAPQALVHRQDLIPAAHHPVGILLRPHEPSDQIAGISSHHQRSRRQIEDLPSGGAVPAPKGYSNYTGVPNHPVSGITDFKPASIAPWQAGDTAEEIAFCLTIKNEYHDLTEWLVHHYNHHGIRRFYIMDDGSSPPMSSYDYSPFVDERAITHVWMDPAERPAEGQQVRVYNKCAEEFGGRHKWMGFIDTDEFIEVKGATKDMTKLPAEGRGEEEPTLHKLLEELEAGNCGMGQLAINWLNHNSGGLEDRPEGKGLRESFTTCIHDHNWIDAGGNVLTKAFVKTEAFEGMGPIHVADLKEGYQSVGENGDRVDWIYREPITRDKIVVHHYATRSKCEYDVKLGRGDVLFDKLLRGERYWREMEEADSFVCTDMTEYVPK